jgi:hypothetical protein
MELTGEINHHYELNPPMPFGGVASIETARLDYSDVSVFLDNSEYIT